MVVTNVFGTWFKKNTFIKLRIKVIFIKRLTNAAQVIKKNRNIIRT